MHVLIAGGTGFIGKALTKHLLKHGHTVTIQTRSPEALGNKTGVIKSFSELSDAAQFDAAINLSGEPIADKRWSSSQKQVIIDSRIDTTNALIGLFSRLKQRPRVFISGSAIGYYGVSKEDKAITEDNTGDTSFSSQLCSQWESCAAQAESLSIRTCLLRTGIVLGSNGGALKKMLPAFNAGLGGKMGSGKQWMPWIHIDDIVCLIVFCIEDASLQGPINATAPSPVSNSTFTSTLGTTLKRPTFLAMPAFVIRFLFGQMGEELLLSGKNVVPKKALSHGFEFLHPTLNDALRDILSPC